MKARVFIVQQPTQRDPATGNVRPFMDLTPASVWGEMKFILRETENPFADPQATADRIAEYLDAEKLTKNDWLVLVGNPILIAMVAARAADITGQLRVLQWSRSEKRYKAVEVQVFEDEERPEAA